MSTECGLCEPDVIWENRFPPALCASFQHGECYATHILFDIFPFDNIAVAMEMLSPIANINDSGEEIDVIFISDLEDGIEDLTKLVIRVIIELAQYQDSWIFLDPIERLHLYAKIMQDIEHPVGEKNVEK